MKKRVLVACPSVPFTTGGAERLVDDLVLALNTQGFEAEKLSLPFLVPEANSLLSQIAIWRSATLNMRTGPICDLLICTKFPSYMLQHHNKVVWMIHQYRQLYELYGTRFGEPENDGEFEVVRQMLMQADKKALNECMAHFAISDNVAKRIQHFLGIEARTLLPPMPRVGKYYHADAEPYLLSVGRLCSIKRVDLLLQALTKVPAEVKLKLVGTADEPGIESYLSSIIDKHHLHQRVEFLGNVSEEELLELYAKCKFVVYVPFDEDYGFVTQEAFAAGKPVLTCSDSGGTLQFVRHEINGLIAEPDDELLAESITRLFKDEILYQRLAAQAKLSVVTLDWVDIVTELTQTL